LSRGMGFLYTIQAPAAASRGTPDTTRGTTQEGPENDLIMTILVLPS
jgi:hypothetical protein